MSAIRHRRRVARGNVVIAVTVAAGTLALAAIVAVVVLLVQAVAGAQ